MKIVSKKKNTSAPNDHKMTLNIIVKCAAYNSNFTPFNSLCDHSFFADNGRKLERKDIGRSCFSNLTFRDVHRKYVT